jgi:hypothetical protein
MNVDFEAYKKTGQHIDYMTWAINKCKKLSKKNTELKNVMIIEEAYYILLDNPTESKASAFMTIHHILIGLGMVWAENLTMDLVI